MKEIKIQGKTGDSTIVIGERLTELTKYLPTRRVVIITDLNVGEYYRKDFPPADVITIGTGEKIKNLDTVREIYARLVALEADRSTFIVAVGGGIVCDIAGFVASTYLRGLRFGIVSTTLLSQVDASVGGKNGVNLDGYKNIVGVFNQPEFVLCDMTLLHSLPGRKLSCGFAEIVKHGAIADTDYFAYIEDHYRNALALNHDVIEKLVYGSVVIKSSIVNRDEKEKGERRKLNFGHTFGHAIEKITGTLHGEAVSAGMVLASAISVRKGLLSNSDDQRIRALLRHLNLPIELEVDWEEVLDAIRKDKKREGDSIHFVLLRGLGTAVVEEISMEELRIFVKDMF